MKVIFKKTASGPWGTGIIGEVKELEDSLAKRFIGLQVVEKYKKEPKKEAKTMTTESAAIASPKEKMAKSGAAKR